MGFNLGVNSNQSSFNQSSLGSGVDLVDVRVRDIVLSSNHPRFEEVGGWSGIGTIIYDVVEGRLSSTADTINFARPLFSNNKFFSFSSTNICLIV